MARWTKLKKRIEDFICEELKERVRFYATVYRETHDQLGKGWIELDKKVIFEANTVEWENEYFRLSDELRKINNCTDFTDKDQAIGYYKAYDDAEGILQKKHKMDEYQFYNSLTEYLNSSIDENLKSNNDLIRILCLLDRRLGKQRLSKFEVRKNDCEAIKMLYGIRQEIIGQE